MKNFLKSLTAIVALGVFSFGATAVSAQDRDDRRERRQERREDRRDAREDYREERREARRARGSNDYYEERREAQQARARLERLRNRNRNGIRNGNRYGYYGNRNGYYGNSGRRRIYRNGRVYYIDRFGRVYRGN